MPDPSEHVLTVRIVPALRGANFRRIVIGEIAIDCDHPVSVGTLIASNRIAIALARHIRAFKMPKEPIDA